jgi:hypothetical protein
MHPSFQTHGTCPGQNPIFIYFSGTFFDLPDPFSNFAGVVFGYAHSL